VAPAGTVLDPSGFVISQASEDQWYPAVSFGDMNFLVAWQDRRGRDTFDIYGARVTPGGDVLDPAGIAISQRSSDQRYPALGYDGVNFLVAWCDGRNDSSDIHGAWVNSDGAVLAEFPVIVQERNQWYPALEYGTAGQLFLVYQGWAGTVGGKVYDVNRIWGKMDPATGLEEGKNLEVRRVKGGATIVRGVLLLDAADSRQNTGDRADLLDIAGRKVLDLRPGLNDVSRLAPGVYFVQGTASPERPAVTKIVVTK